MHRRAFIKGSLAGVGGALLLDISCKSAKQPPAPDARLKGAFRSPERNGWTFVHLEGTPAEIGYQHGYLLADRIEDATKVTILQQTHNRKCGWDFYRGAAKSMLWPKIEAEYREELQGIADGLRARGSKLDLWDVVALNASMEWDYYMKEYDKTHKDETSADLAAPEHCSAFAATGSYTKDGKIVIAHNCWTGYLDGERWTIIYDIAPSHGYRMLMDGFPGFIHSGDDFGINSTGITITETTISGFSGYDPSGIPEFVRARKGMQYSSSIDDYVRIMKTGNNGGYANNWLIADHKTNEVADLELGLKNVNLWRTKDGFFVGSNFPVSPKLASEETNFDLNDMSNSANARHVRWKQLMAENKGKIDMAMAQKFMGDHYDSFAKKEDPSERTLCGHVDLSPRGSGTWQPPYGIAGAVQNKGADAAMIEKMALSASAGHCCGIDFNAAEHLKKHPEFNWEAPLLRDMPSKPWTLFSTST
ncbi:MAG TPA: C45 family peptidase [Terriglobia bacterium]|nr:C45 family peptidase [Terriglobia bacterium]